MDATGPMPEACGTFLIIATLGDSLNVCANAVVAEFEPEGFPTQQIRTQLERTKRLTPEYAVHNRLE
jgi:hypothetical protein